MSGRRNQSLGTAPCPGCGYQVAIYETGTGKLSFTCDGCMLSGYSPPNSRSYKKLRDQVKPWPEEAPGAGPAPAPAPPAARRGGFDLGNLGGKR